MKKVIYFIGLKLSLSQNIDCLSVFFDKKITTAVGTNIVNLESAKSDNAKRVKDQRQTVC